MQGPPDNPWPLFHAWIARAKPLGEQLGEGMTLATVAADGRPSARTVLYRGLVREGIAFYTNYDSRKARDLAANPWAALAFYWQTLGRQLRIEGRVERLTRAESEAYFNGRPRGSQIASWASPQSAVLATQKDLVQRVHAVEQRFAGTQAIPCPEFWGGYRLEPAAFEFWTEGEHRLHERVAYACDAAGVWQARLLGP